MLSDVDETIMISKTNRRMLVREQAGERVDCMHSPGALFSGCFSLILSFGHIVLYLRCSDPLLPWPLSEESHLLQQTRLLILV